MERTIYQPSAEEQEWIANHHRYTGKLASKAMKAKALQGDLPGCAPIGCLNSRQGDKSIIIPDSIQAPLVRDTFELAAQGSQSLRKILSTMTEKGLRSRNGKKMGVSALWTMLTNPFYTGKISYDGQVLNGNHTSIVDPKLFDRVQAGLDSRRKR